MKHVMKQFGGRALLVLWAVGMNRIALWFFAAHLPVFSLIGWANDTGGWTALVLTSLTLLGPILAMRSLASRRNVSIVMGITAMFMGGLLVHFGQGPVQIEMHFYFFVLLALVGGVCQGNAAIFKLERVANACHTIEDYISEYGELPSGSEWTELFGSWAFNSRLKFQP
jgi:hypothetical protein